jgi:hypothetical protein
VGNFRLDQAHTNRVPALLNSVASGLAAFDVELGPVERFGVERNLPVLLAPHPVFHHLHELLTAGLRDMTRFVAAEPAFWGDGYRPHVTLSPVVSVRDGDILTFTTLTLVSLHGNIGKRVSAVELA